MQPAIFVRGFSKIRGASLIRLSVVPIKLVLWAVQQSYHYMVTTTRGGAAAARVAHNHEVPGSSPGPATKILKLADKRYENKAGVFDFFNVVLVCFIDYENTMSNGYNHAATYI